MKVYFYFFFKNQTIEHKKYADRYIEWVEKIILLFSN